MFKGFVELPSLIPIYQCEKNFTSWSTSNLDITAPPGEMAECRGKAGGTPFVARVVHIVTIRDGKVVRIQAYPDTGTMAAATR